MSKPTGSRPSLLRDPIFRRLLRLVLAHRGWLAVVVVCMAVVAGSELLLARLAGLLVDIGLIERQPGAAIWLPLAFVGVFVVRGIAGFASSMVLNRVSQSVLVDLRGRMFERLTAWPQKTLEDTSSGVIVSKFVNEASNALAAATEVLITIVRDTLTVIALICLLVYYNWQLTLVTLVVVPLIAWVLRAFGRRMRRLSLDSQAMLGEMTRAVQEAHDGSRVIKIYAGQVQERERFAEINNKLRRYAMKMQVGWSGATPVTQFIAAIGMAVVFSIALWQARTQALSAGEFVTFITAALMLLAPLRHLAGLNGPIARMLAAGESVFGMIDTPSEAETGTRTIEGAQGQVSFDRVSFRYPGANAGALNEVTLDVRPGEMIALVGPSGAGKTTFINLLPRFIEPVAGEIRLDGVPLQALTRASLRAQMALVSQDVVLFDDTIAANIAFGGTREASEARIRAAAEEEERAFYHGRAPQEWIDALAPLGTDEHKPHLTDAPWVVVLFRQAHGVLPDGRKRTFYYTQESCGIAAGLFIAAVHHMGLVTLTHTPNPMGFLGELLGRPPHEKAMLVMPVGYPAPDARVPDIRRKALEEIASWRE